MRKIEEASRAIAEAVKLCKPGVIATYPITPQTHIVERLADFKTDGSLKSELINAESEHSALSACVGASAMGVRTFTATCSQGLALMHEILFIASGMRLPIVMANANRALSAPINIWNDQSDSIASRDSGWIQLYVESSQEAFDTIIQAYKIAENKNVLLPVMVCLDGFTLSHVWESVEIASQKEIDNFLPDYKPLYKLDINKPVTMGPVGAPDSYMEFKQEQQKAILNSINIIKQVHEEYADKFKRSYGNGLIETYKIENADTAIVAMGSICGTAKVLIDELIKKGKKVGLIKIRCFRPFPREDLIKICKRIKNLAVLDRDISFGNKGALYTEIRDALYDYKVNIKNYIVGLGGRDVTKEHLKKALSLQNKEWLL